MMQALLQSPITHWITLFIDFVVVYFLVYQVLIWIAHTRTENLTLGLLLIGIVYVISHSLKLPILTWILNKFATVLVIAIIIIFQPELRRLLDRIGRGYLFTTVKDAEFQSATVIKQLVKAIEYLSKEKIGALIAIESGTPLNEYIDSGIPVDSIISTNILITLFWPQTPTHDGAVIIRGSRIKAAGCLLPLSTARIADRRLGTRHRSAMGLSEKSDALIIIISEETGVVSIAENGNLTRYLNRQTIETRLFNLYK